MRKPQYLLVILMCLVFGSTPQPIIAGDLQGKVVEVVDGETLVVSYSGNLVRVQLCTLSAPKGAHPLAAIVRQHLADFVLNKFVSVHYFRMQGGVVEGLVMLNGNDIGIQMIRDGAANYNSGYDSKISAVARQAYFDSERAARNEMRGIWQGSEPPTTPQRQDAAQDTVNPSRTRDSYPGTAVRTATSKYESSEDTKSWTKPVAADSLIMNASPGSKSVVWSRGADGCDDLFSEGQYFRVLRADGIEIVLTMYDGNDYRVADVFISNVSDKRKLIDPSMTSFSLADSGKRAVSLSPIPTQKIASKIKRRAKWANFFSALAASIPQTSTARSTTDGTLSVYGNDGSYARGTFNGTTTTTVTSPNVYAQARTAEDNRRRSFEAASKADQLQETSLKMNTLFPGERAVGLIYFEKKKFEELGTFQILIDGTIYKFSFTPFVKK